jgi:hypothetical protein
MVAGLSPPMSVEKIQLKLKQKINIKGDLMRGCSLLPDGRMVLSCYKTDTATCINKEGVDLFQIGKDKTGSSTYDIVYIKDNSLLPDVATYSTLYLLLLMISHTNLSVRFSIFNPLFSVQ